MCRTLELGRSIDAKARHPIARFDRRTCNGEVITSNLIVSEGSFMASIHCELRRRNIEVPLHGHDLIAEMRGQVALPTLREISCG